MTNTFGIGVTHSVDGDVFYSDDYYDTLADLRFDLVTNSPAVGANIVGVIAHSATVYSVLANATIYLTSDSGTTYTSKNTDLETTPLMIGARTDKTLGFAIETGSATAETAYTSDSGTTWTTKTSAVFGTGIYDASMPSSSLIVICGTDAGVGAIGIQFSTNQGGTWTDATTTPDVTYSVAMFDTTTGYAIDNASNIWKTTDGAVNWTDTTHNTTSAPNAKSRIYAISATVCLIHHSNGIDYYDNSAGAPTFRMGFPGNCGGIIETTNGRIYFVGLSGAAAPMFLLRTTDDGVTFKRTVIPGTGSADNEKFKGGISELGTDNLIISGGDSTMFKIEVSD